MANHSRPPSTQPSTFSEDDYTTSLPDIASFYSAGEWMGSLPTGTVLPASTSELYMPAAFDARAAKVFMVPQHPSQTTPYSDPTTSFAPSATSYYGSPASTASEPAFLHASESPAPGQAEAGDSAEKKKPKRNRANRYKNAHPAVLSRRRAQNRESQRAYRRRKDDRIAELEQLLGEATDREHSLSQAYATLKAEYDQLLTMGSSQGSVTDNDLSIGFLSPPQTMLSMAYDDGSGSAHSKDEFPHSSSSHPSQDIQFPRPQLTLDGDGTQQLLLSQLRTGGDLPAKDSLKMEFSKQLLQPA